MVKNLFIGLFVVICVMLIAFVVGGFVLSHEFEVERSVVIEATPAEIHAYVGDLSHWPAWSPWKESDPEMEISLGEQVTGVGAEQRWDAKAGDGRLIFTAVDEQEGIKFDLLLREGSIKNTAAITYEPLPEGTTRVTWWMGGRAPDSLFGGYLALMMDGSIGGMFVRGLTRLEMAVEEGPPEANVLLQNTADTASETASPAEASTETP